MQGTSKKAKKSGQFSGSVGSRPAQVVSMNFADTTNQIRVSWAHKWSDIYEFIKIATEATKLPPRMIRASDESDTNDEVYNDELLRLQRSGSHKIASRLMVLQITKVL